MAYICGLGCSGIDVMDEYAYLVAIFNRNTQRMKALQPQRSTHSMYYLAVVCPPVLDAQILQFKHWMRDRFQCVVALRSPAHITLIPPFWLANAQEPLLISTLQAFKSSMPPIQIELRDFGHFGNRVIFVQVKENPALVMLKSEIENYFHLQLPAVIQPEGRKFHPHVTIANRDVTPAAFHTAWQQFSRQRFTAAFETRTLTLLQLRQGRWHILAESHWS